MPRNGESGDNAHTETKHDHRDLYSQSGTWTLMQKTLRRLKA